MARRKGPRPHEPSPKDRQTAEVLAGFGIPHNNIAMVVGIDRKTLEKHYGAELERGGATVEAKLAGNLLRIASGSDAAALKATIFALQCRFGWRIPAELLADAPDIGKKAAAQQKAHYAAEKFAVPPSPPRMQ